MVQKNKKIRVEITGNTALKIEENIYYDANEDLYQKFKKGIIIIAIILGGICIFGILCFKNYGWLQSLFSALLGGILSVVVWWCSVYLTDKMNYKVKIIDSIIMDIDQILFQINSFDYYFVDGINITKIKPENYYFRVAKLYQMIINLSNIKFTKNDMEFTWFNNSKLTTKEFGQKLQEILDKAKRNEFSNDKEILQLVEYNERYLWGQLNELKNILIKRKTYILCGNAPMPQEIYKKKYDDC